MSIQAEEEQRPTTGPEAIYDALSRVDVESLEREQRDIVRKGPKSKRARAVRILNALEGMRRNDILPKDLMVRKVPVIPAAFRPFNTVGDTFIPGDANELYRDLINLKNSHQEVESLLGPEGAGDSRLNVYDAVRAVYGFGDPVEPKTKQRGVSGFMKNVIGSRAKFCYDDETEILTRKYGWVLFKDLPEDTEVGTINPNTLAFEWQTPYAYHHSRYVGEMVRTTVGKRFSKRMDLLVTPTHQHWVKTRSSSGVVTEDEMKQDWGKVDAAELVYRRGHRRYIMMAAVEWEGMTELPDSLRHWDRDHLCKVLGWWLSDGDLHTDRYSTNIWQSESNCVYCRELEEFFNELSKAGHRVGHYDHKTPKGVKAHGWAIHDKELTSWLEQEWGAHSHNKRIPRNVLDWDKKSLSTILKTYLKGDGSKRDKKGSKHNTPNHRFRSDLTDDHHAFVTVSSGLKDDLMELCFKVGVAVRRDKPHPELYPDHHREAYDCQVIGRWFCQTTSSGVSKFQDYDGHVHCCAVDNGVLVVRRNGAAVASGNSYVQRKMLSKPQDAVSRATIVSDPDLSLDEIGVPEESAWKMYGPHVQRRLVQSGMQPAAALRELVDRGERARKAMDKELEDRPVIYSRAPSWHKWNVVAGRPKLRKGHAIGLNTLVLTGLNADFDGDAMNLHVPATKESVDEARKKLMPSKMLFDIRDFDKVVPVPKHEMILGLSNAQSRPAGKKHKFNSEREALAAVQAGEIDLNDEVEF